MTGETLLGVTEETRVGLEATVTDFDESETEFTVKVNVLLPVPVNLPVRHLIWVEETETIWQELPPEKLIE